MAFAQYKQLTLDASQSGSADSTDWPLCIGLGYGPQAADVDLKDSAHGGVIRPDGFDLAWFDSVAQTTRYAAERVLYDGVNGKLSAWVKIPTLDHTTNTTLYLFYGDASIATDPNTIGTYGSTNVWDSSYKGVWHLPVVSGTVTANDSISGGHNGTVTGATATTGQIDGAASFTSTSHIINFGTGVADLVGDFTISGWFNRNASSSNDRLVLYGRWDNTASPGQSLVYFDGTGSGIFKYAIPNVGDVINSTTLFPYGNTNWNHYVVTRSGNNYALYFNGTATADATATDATTPPTGGAACVGNLVGLVGLIPVRGLLDETRISNVVRSVSDAVVANYYSQKSSSTFITWGAATSVSGGHLLSSLGAGA